jgi:hypothetical protein
MYGVGLSTISRSFPVACIFTIETCPQNLKSVFDYTILRYITESLHLSGKLIRFLIIFFEPWLLIKIKAL